MRLSHPVDAGPRVIDRADIALGVEPAGQMNACAVTQVAAVLGERAGEAPVQRLFETAGVARHLTASPMATVAERDVLALHRTLRRQLGPACARAVARAAGRRTADHLLVRHLPAPVRHLLPRLPRPVVARLLLVALERDICRLAGSGTFVGVYGRPMRLGLSRDPRCCFEDATGPICDFLAGTLEHLFRSLLGPATNVQMITCAAGGAPACIFEIEV